jgi:stage III sporulation protein AD
MDNYLRTVCITLIGILLCLILSNRAKDYSILLGIILCSTICTLAAAYLKPVLELVAELGEISTQITPWLKVLMKAVGLSFIGETAGAICADAGQAAVGKVLQILTTVVILWVSLPLIQSLMDLILNILEML